MVLLVSAGERHELTRVEPRREHGAVKRRGRGRPRVRPRRVAGAKGSRYPQGRRYRRRRGIGAVIPTRSNQPRLRSVDRVAYRERNRVERLSNRLKQYRRVATRYEQRAVNYLAMLTRAAILLWL
jgi:transposase